MEVQANDDAANEVLMAVGLRPGLIVHSTLSKLGLRRTPDAYETARAGEPRPFERRRHHHARRVGL
ncbi:hypothetical protein AGR1B_pb0022 [Agrobacterium fabacearum S56]|nr:hypothetical protein AGR1B_pb0022 [Agrobacterium fabacearum S56]